MHEALLRRHDRPQLRDVAAHRARRDRPDQRQQQPLNPLRGHLGLLAQPLRDPLPPRGPPAPPRRRHPRPRGRLADGPPHRLDVQLQPPGDLPLPHVLRQMQVASLGPLRQPDHLHVPLAESTKRPVPPRRSSPGNRRFLGAQALPFEVATRSFLMLPLPPRRGRPASAVRKARIACAHRAF